MRHQLILRRFSALHSNINLCGNLLGSKYLYITQIHCIRRSSEWPLLRNESSGSSTCQDWRKTMSTASNVRFGFFAICRQESVVFHTHKSAVFQTHRTIVFYMSAKPGHSFLFSINARTISRAHSGCFATGTGAWSPGIKWWVGEADHLLLINTEVKNTWSCTFHFSMSSWYGA